MVALKPAVAVWALERGIPKQERRGGIETIYAGFPRPPESEGSRNAVVALKRWWWARSGASRAGSRNAVVALKHSSLEASPKS